ncbi:MAG: hypothetical protein MRQ13_04445 [Candidatus Midichloria sp.]|nr:hypothetical protein [Candidatus Midichloria sp.]
MSQIFANKKRIRKASLLHYYIQSSKATKLNDLVKILEDANHEVSMSLHGSAQ